MHKKFVQKYFYKTFNLLMHFIFHFVQKLQKARLTESAILQLKEILNKNFLKPINTFIAFFIPTLVLSSSLMAFNSHRNSIEVHMNDEVLNAGSKGKKKVGNDSKAIKD